MTDKRNGLYASIATELTRRRMVGRGRRRRACDRWGADSGDAVALRLGEIGRRTRSAAPAAVRRARPPIGKTALVGMQMAVDRINKAGGINWPPVELIVDDYESKPDVGRRKAEKLVVEDKIDAHVGGSSPTSAWPACRCTRSTRSST